MKRITVPNRFWQAKAMMYDGRDGTFGFAYDKMNLACPLMLFNATVPLYEADYMPDNYEEACQEIVVLKRRIKELEHE